MDPISHAVFGYTVVRAVRPSTNRLAVAACIGALAPDVDAVFMPLGWDVYLRAHEIGTHAFAGTLPVALLVALGVRGRTRAPLTPLFMAAWLAALSHLALDVLSGARIQLGWPLFVGRSLVPLVAMAEPWLIAFFSASLLVLAIARGHRRASARWVLAVLSLLFAVKGLWLVEALGTLGTSPDGPVEARIVEARWFTLRDWHVFERTPTLLTHFIVSPAHAPLRVESWPRSADTPLIERSRRLDTVRNLLDVHELTFAQERTDAEGHRDVLWSDIRFCWTPRARSIGDTDARPLVLGSASQPIACGLWFGGSYDQAGRALIQRVQVFGRWQTRPVRP